MEETSSNKTREALRAWVLIEVLRENRDAGFRCEGALEVQSRFHCFMQLSTALSRPGLSSLLTNVAPAGMWILAGAPERKMIPMSVRSPRAISTNSCPRIGMA